MGPSPPRIILYKGSASSFFDDLGGIGPRGFRTPLFFFDKHVNSQSYMKCLLDNHVFEEIEKILLWQQDNAPSHRSKYTQGFLSKIIPEYLPCPPQNKSGLISKKKKLAGQHFQSKEELFNAIANVWDNIPNEKLHNYYSSFWARCYICKKTNGESFNGKWHDIKEIHNQYRTQLHYVVDENTGETFIYEH